MHDHHLFVDNYLRPHNSPNFTAGARSLGSFRHAEANKLGPEALKALSTRTKMTSVIFIIHCIPVNYIKIIKLYKICVILHM